MFKGRTGQPTILNTLQHRITINKEYKHIEKWGIYVHNDNATYLWRRWEADLRFSASWKQFCSSEYFFTAASLNSTCRSCSYSVGEKRRGCNTSGVGHGFWETQYNNALIK